MRRRRSRRYLILALVVGLFYIFLFPQPGGREGIFRPVWVRPPSGAPSALREAPGQGGRVSWFRAGRTFGYVGLDGELLHSGELQFGVALSEAGFISYPRVGESFIFQDPRGRFQYAARGHGYPVLESSGERLYSVSTDLTELRRLDRDGEPFWSAAFFSPLTSLSLFGEQCAAGLLDGTVKLFDPEGRIAQEFAPEPSRLPVILGVALSGDRLAVLSGIDPQRLTVLERRSGSFAPFLDFPTGSDLRREARLEFTADGRFLAYELDTGLGLLELKRGQRTQLGLPGRLLALASSPGGLLAVGARDGPGCSLRILRLPAQPLYEHRLAQPEVFLRFVGGSLLVGFPGRLLRVDYLEG